VFPLIRENRLWLGASHFNRGMYFQVPENFQYASTYRFDRERNGVKVNRVPGVCWFTNLEHGRRYEPLGLMTMADNLRFSRHREIQGRAGHPPPDTHAAMGVPITFLDRYCPEQFEILGASESEGSGFSNGLWRAESGVAQPMVDARRVYKRIFIRRRG